MTVLERLAAFLVAVAALALVIGSTVAFALQPGIPREAARYQDDLVRQARFHWGFNAPIRMFAGQIHQESAWRADARSPYASGLTQFTPDTARWISGAYPRDLSAADPMNPVWAIRAMLIYDLRLYRSVEAATPCDRMAMALQAYNAGLGWHIKEAKLAPDPLRWFGSVETVCLRRASACAESHAYPRKILLRWQPLYAAWGPGVDCSHVAAS